VPQDLGTFVRNSIAAVNAKFNALMQRQAGIEAQHQLIMKMCEGAPSITEEIDSIPGRRIFYNLAIEPIRFTLADAGRRGAPGNALVSQDGPFVMTHYPLAVWRPSAPLTATNLGLWRPVSSYPLPDQATGTGFALNEDIISISWELSDGGSQRNFQNLPIVPVLSRPDNLVPLPVPTIFTPNTTIQWFPTFNSIRFSDPTVAPTEGLLEVALPGYRIVNM